MWRVSPTLRPVKPPQLMPPLAMELITTAAMAVNPHPRRILDIGCGAGNNAIALTHLYPEVDCGLVDLSAPMLERACGRLQPVCRGGIQTFQGDIRELSLPEERYDVILAAGPAAPRGFHAGGGTAQKLVLCRLWCGEGLRGLGAEELSAAEPHKRRGAIASREPAIWVLFCHTEYCR